MKLQKHICMLAIAMIFLFSSSSHAVQRANKSDEQPPAIEKGWNLISVPCDITLKEFKQKHGMDGIDAYSWNGSEYVKTEDLKRGVGYVINSDSVINPSAVCDIDNSASGFVMTLKKGWNLIGNPYRQSIAVAELFGSNKDKISSMYEYKGNKYVAMKIDEKMKPWRGFWVYADEDVSSPSPMTCSLKVNAYMTQESGEKPLTGSVSVKLDEMLYLAAIETCKTASGLVEESDVTASADWNVYASYVGSLASGGVFKPLSEGKTSVTATNNKLSASITIEVYDYETTLIVRNKGEYELFPGEKTQLIATAYYHKKSCNVYLRSDNEVNVYGNNCNLRSEDVTNKVQWEIKPSTGSIANGEFTAETIGTTIISASMDSLISNALMLKVAENAWLYLSVIGEHPFAKSYGCVDSGCYYAFAGKETPFKVLGQKTSWVWTGTARKDLTSLAEWEVSDESIATIDEQGKMTPKKKGQIWIRATIGDARSDKVLVQVLDDAKSEFLIIGISSNGFKPVKPLKVGDKYAFKATKFTYDPADAKNCSYDSSGICFQTDEVTAKVVWKLSDEAVAKQWPLNCANSDYCENRQYVEGTSPGFVDVSAGLDGLVSNSITLDVWKFSSLDACDPAKMNVGTWTDIDTTIAILETDCDTYKVGENVKIRYTAKVDPEHGWLLDNCLDLVVMNDNDEIVKTFRYEGCSSEDMTGRKSAKEMDVVYQSLSVWDMKDDAGNTVPTGKYYAVARFYILWEPVIRLPFNIMD